MINIPSDVAAVIGRLREKGYKAYVVGGCVRDALMNREPNDWDVTTSALPNEIKEVFASCKTVDVGIQHGTVLVLWGSTPVEVTTFRIDGEYKDNRHPDSVAFTADLEKDLARRDFTVNAMAYNHEEGVIDVFGGREDIDKKIIRCVGDPNKRFSEDALRILRAMRFSSVLDFSIEEKTSDAVILNSNLLSAVSAERITSELIKLLTGENVFDVLMRYGSVLGVFIPELQLEFDFMQKDEGGICEVWTRTARSVALIEDDPILRLAMLLHNTGKPATHALGEDGMSTFKNCAAVGGLIADNILRRLKFSNEYITTVSTLVSLCDREIPRSRVEIKEFLRDRGESIYIDFLKIKRADAGAMGFGMNEVNDRLIYAYSAFNEIMESEEPYSLKQLALKGSDIKKYAAEKEIGEKLNYLLDCVIRDPEKNTKARLMDILKSGL